MDRYIRHHGCATEVAYHGHPELATQSRASCPVLARNKFDSRPSCRRNSSGVEKLPSRFYPPEKTWYWLVLREDAVAEKAWPAVDVGPDKRAREHM